MKDQIHNELVVPFTMVPNEILSDPNLSLKQKGMLCYLISLPKGWTIYKSELENRFTDGRESISNALEDLVKMEFVSKVENPKQKGKFSGFTYTVLPLRVNRNGLTAAVNPQLINTNSNNTNRVNLNINTDFHSEKSVVNKKASNKKPENESYRQIIDFWLKDFHPDFTFTATSGRKIKSIITKFKTLLKNEGRPATDDAVVNAFKFMCLHLPDFYKNKDLNKIDSSFNEIISEIKDKNNGKPKSKPTTAAESIREGVRNAFPSRNNPVI